MKYTNVVITDGFTGEKEIVSVKYIPIDPKMLKAMQKANREMEKYLLKLKKGTRRADLPPFPEDHVQKLILKNLKDKGFNI